MIETIVTKVGIVVAVVAVATVFARWLRADIHKLDERLTANVNRVLERLPAP